MDRKAYETLRFEDAAELLPRELRYAALRLPEETRARVEEFRLRAGRGMSIVCAGEETFLTNGQGMTVYRSDLDSVLQVATQASAHTVLDRVRNGFVTIRGGHRIGLCGSAVMRSGQISNLDQISSLSIRIARELPGIAASVVPQLMENGRFQSTLILSPPGTGKTTLLRDVIRLLSEGKGDELPALRVGLADERSEVAAMYDGLPQMDIGPRTDVLDGCPKSLGMLMLLRGMNPQVLAADEITAPEDAAALEMAANCGVALLATAHGFDQEDLSARPLYHAILERRIFQRLVTIELAEGKRQYTVSSLGKAP